MLKRLKSLFKKDEKKHSVKPEIMNIFRKKYANFKVLLESNSELLKIISDIEEKLSGEHIFSMSYIQSNSARAIFHTAKMLKSFEDLSDRNYPVFKDLLDSIQTNIKKILEYKSAKISEYVLSYTHLNKDSLDFVGGKNANLGEVKNNVNLPIPKGFAITTTAFEEFIKSNDLMDEIQKYRMELIPNDLESAASVSENIQKIFMAGHLPKSIEEPILNAYEEYIDKDKKIKVAMRSSAILEDGEYSFAGQYLSVLNVPYDKIIEEYKRVLCSLFSPRAMLYRLHIGIPFEEAAMSVACLEMVDAKSSGVMYSRHPFNLLENNVIINAVWGVGTYVVDGVVTPDTYILSKDLPPVLLDVKISKKSKQAKTDYNGYIAEEQVELEKQNIPCLTEQEAIKLAEYAIILEKHFQSHQDIEWAIDQNGNINILQTRPLKISIEKSKLLSIKHLEGYKTLLNGGSIACPGVGFGPAYHVHSEKDLLAFPDGAILIAAHSSPQYVIAMQKAQAIVTNAGSVTGHMASLAREFNVPSLLNTGSATTVIKQGEMITVDAYSGRVYLGKVPELIEMRIQKGSFMKNKPIYQILKKISQYIIPLNLVDPKSPKFSPSNCKTVHDIMRFFHEMSYMEVFQISDFSTDYGKVSVKLNIPLPIDLYIIDLGGGLNISDRKSKIKPEHISSNPFKALMTGMLNKKLKPFEPRPINIGGFFSVMSQQMLSPPNLAVERFGDKSYAIVSDKYLNFSSRVGYHYSVLDSYCGQTATKNYINFQFKGGAADELRRNRRVRLIEKILEVLGFLVETQGDRVTARFAKQEPDTISEKLDYLGRLLIFTRQLDMLMHSENSVTQLSQCFLDEHYDLSNLK
ncbi:MAG: phosphoenolpyruvate synthase [Desulfobacterales bacterium]|nr:phosphoenolpyruvate synthase [Desulfobacterales bacterium]